ncbi:MAG: peptide-methionine (S)-S-oxide reductase MsrA [Candidatus Bipolaricaulota bacterium]
MLKEANFIIYAVITLLMTLALVGLTTYSEEDRNAVGTAVVPEIDRNTSEEVETATFALGCFWGGEALFGAQPGIIRTRVGYAGGTSDDPTYRNIGDHTESIQVDYDPGVITFRELVEIFWNNHDPATESYKKQYDNILFYQNEEQKVIAESSKERLSEELDGGIQTRVTELKNFYLAEQYHQKYRLKQNRRFIDELREIYPDPNELTDSTAAARLNGYLAGYGSSDSVEANLGKLGLSEDARAELEERFDTN